MIFILIYTKHVLKYYHLIELTLLLSNPGMFSQLALSISSYYLHLSGSQVNL